MILEIKTNADINFWYAISKNISNEIYFSSYKQFIFALDKTINHDLRHDFFIFI